MIDDALMKIIGSGIAGVALVWIIFDQKAQIKELKATLLLKDAEIKSLNELIRTIQKDSIAVAAKITDVVENLITYIKEKLK